MGVSQQLFLLRLAYGGAVSPEYELLLNVAGAFSYRKVHRLDGDDLEVLVRAQVKQCSAPSHLWDCIRNTKTPYALQKADVQVTIHGLSGPCPFTITEADPQYALAFTSARETCCMDYVAALRQRSRKGMAGLLYRTRVYVIGESAEGRRLPGYIGRIPERELGVQAQKLLTRAARGIYRTWRLKNPVLEEAKRTTHKSVQPALVTVESVEE